MDPPHVDLPAIVRILRRGQRRRQGQYDLYDNKPAHSKATIGDSSFCLASSSVWNSIQNDVNSAHHHHQLNFV